MRIISLACKNCSAPLQIKEGVDQLVCAHCGAQMVVERGGGTISLELGEAIRTGAAQTAAELALVRLEKELSAASHRVYQLEGQVKEESQAHDSLKKLHLMSYEEAASAKRRVAELALEVKKDETGTIVGITSLILISIYVLRVWWDFATFGFLTGMGALIGWGILVAVVLVFVGVRTQLLVDKRQGQAKAELDKVSQQLHENEQAFGRKAHFSGIVKQLEHSAEQLPEARAHLAQIEEEIARNREIVRMR